MCHQVFSASHEIALLNPHAGVERRACSQASEIRLSALSLSSQAFKLALVFPLEVKAFLHHVIGYLAHLGCCEELTEEPSLSTVYVSSFPLNFHTSNSG